MWPAKQSLNEFQFRRAAMSIRTSVLMLALLTVASTHASAGTSPFAIRGIKGLCWYGIGNYQKALPWLADHNLNFLMLCYTSFPASASDWRSDYKPEELDQFRDLAAQGRKLGVDVCLAVNPAVYGKPLTYSSEQDYQTILGKLKAVQSRGVNWFALCLDDIRWELEPADRGRFSSLQDAQLHFVNRLWRDLQALRPAPRLIFCPSTYFNQQARQHSDYTRAIGEGLDRSIMVFWTGPDCCSASVTAADAREFGALIKRKPFVWDNYPVNDMYTLRPLVGPLKNRSADLPGEVSGYISNPMQQWTISKIPLSATAEYLNDPTHYDPAAAIQRSIRSFPSDQQRAVRLLVELYGSSFWGEKDFPPQPRPKSREDAEKLLPKYRVLRRELASNPGLADIRSEVVKALESDIAVLERRAGDRLLTSPLMAFGYEFDGGAAADVGNYFYGRSVNLVYAVSSGRSEMHVDFVTVGRAPQASLRLVAMNGDIGAPPKIRLSMNGRPFFEGASPFDKATFGEKVFEIPPESMKPGMNTLGVDNLEPEGPLGMPPWFMVAEAELRIGPPK